MRSAPALLTPLARFAVLAALACGCVSVQAQVLSPNYALTMPSLLAEPEVIPGQAIAAYGPVRLASSGRSGAGSGLSLEAGENWFARAGIGRSLDGEAMSVGGGFRFTDGDALSMAVTRQLGQERLGLAVRYDWRQAWLRLSYDQPVRTPGAADRVRFSAGMRF